MILTLIFIILKPFLLFLLLLVSMILDHPHICSKEIQGKIYQVYSSKMNDISIMYQKYILTYFSFFLTTYRFLLWNSLYYFVNWSDFARLLCITHTKKSSHINRIVDHNILYYNGSERIHHRMSIKIRTRIPTILIHLPACCVDWCHVRTR